MLMPYVIMCFSSEITMNEFDTSDFESPFDFRRNNHTKQIYPCQCILNSLDYWKKKPPAL